VAADKIDVSQNEDGDGPAPMSAEIANQSRLSPTQQKSVL